MECPPALKEKNGREMTAAEPDEAVGRFGKEKNSMEGKGKRWYTPDEWEAERGEAWSDDAAVYYVTRCQCHVDEDWRVGFYREVKALPPGERRETIVVCGTEAGCPPALKEEERVFS
jgi:hypothetical protein